VHELVGQWEEAEQDYRQALKRAKNLNDWYLIGRSNRRLGQLLMLRGNYPEEAKKHLDVAVTCFELASDQVGIAKTYGNLGTFFSGRAVTTPPKAGLPKPLRSTASCTARCRKCRHRGQPRPHFHESGPLRRRHPLAGRTTRHCRTRRDKQGLTTLVHQPGHHLPGKRQRSTQRLLCLEKGLALSEELGNKLFMTICIGSIGSVWEKKGDYGKAMQNFERDLALVPGTGRQTRAGHRLRPDRRPAFGDGRI
jgi:tetratricopeptide (TPR) repeat protein